MKHTLHKILSAFLLMFLLSGVLGSSFVAFAATTSKKDDPVYTTLRTIDLGTFNEYRYKITEQFFVLREYFEVNDKMDIRTLQNIAKLADTGYKYLPNNLKNQNYLRELLIQIKKGVNAPEDEIIYNEIVKALAAYLENVDISSISGEIEANPLSGNAPLTSTFRAKVQDPTGTQILSGNYTWWIDSNGKKLILGRGPSLNYSFKEEGKYTVFLDVTSSHKNAEGYTDVLPFRERIEVNVNEKIASVLIKVNGDTVNENQEMKFTPAAADYGLVFDATSSTPTSGTRFAKTEWDFGNGVKRVYNGSPKIERVRYGLQGDYTVTLRLTTNEGKTVTKYFSLFIRDPIATIEVNRQDGYIGDSFTFSAKASAFYKDLNYNWEILDIENDKLIYQKTDKTITYEFTDKGRYNVQLKVRRPSGELDQDNRIVYVTSQDPIAEFETRIPAANKPNRVFFDATRSYDPDKSDDGLLKYDWFINGNKVNLEQSNVNGSTGYYVFDSVGTQSVVLEVTDPDGIMVSKKQNVEITSILSVEAFAFPRVVQRGNPMKFVAQSPKATVYEWNFGDGITSGGNKDSVVHSYEKSGSYDVQLKVSDSENTSNTFTTKVYVADSDAPFALITPTLNSSENLVYAADACNGKGGYLADRTQAVTFAASESIDITGENTGLDYSWKIGNSKFSTAASVNHRFDEIGCFPVKLTVKSQKNGKTHSSEMNVDVRNLAPTLSSVSVQVENPDADPLVIRVNALGATDPDGVIQSYLWYYYTDIDPTPQDFRATVGPSTAFVIPKITGNYYFVAILKDNNELRVNSEEITGSRYFTTITGDNINTPIITLAVSDNTTIIGEEVTFTANASNILGQKLEKDVEYSWDFDGDGFYDTQSKTPNISYIYRKSGEFYAKVKVKYKGVSSTRNITMNVSNKLVADFDYISVGNTFIFFDTSSGLVENREWTLPDGTKKTESTFEYTFSSGNAADKVKLKVTEGSNVKEVEKEITKNFKNIIKARKGGLVVFSSPEIPEDGKIILDDPSERVFIYMGESEQSTASYAIDYDTEHDSDLNGGKDDDENNKGTASYISGNVTEIPLSQYKTQKVRLFLKDDSGQITASQDFTIEKTYITQEEINPDTIIFEGVTESEKQKIETLKTLLMQLPQEQKLKALSFVQKLQENWADDTEKTRTILDFESYIFELGLKNENEIISLLESLLVEGQADQSTKQITYQALVNLIPKEIVCTVEGGTCYDNLLSKLEDIRNSDDIEANKILGSEILTVIGTTDLMSTEQKLDFKAILYTFVYGDVESIPETEKQEVISETPDTSGGFSGLMGIIVLIAKILGGILAFFLLVIGIFFVAYKIFNKDETLSFTDYISRKTSFEKTDVSQNSSGVQDDILAEFLNDTPKTEASGSTQTPKVDPLAVTQMTEKIAETPAVKEEVPDWLKSTFSNNTPSVSSTPEISQELPKESPLSEMIPEKNIQAEVSDGVLPESLDIPKVEESKVTDIQEENIPDWLKGSFTPETSSQTVSDTQIPVQSAPIEVPIADISQTSAGDISSLPETSVAEPIAVDVPDWLKGSFDPSPVSEVDAETVSTEALPETSPVPEPVASQTAEKKSPSAKKTPVKKEKTEKKTQKKEEDTPPKKAEELWDDGMKIPDWLKSDDT